MWVREMEEIEEGRGGGIKIASTDENWGDWWRRRRRRKNGKDFFSREKKIDVFLLSTQEEEGSQIWGDFSWCAKPPSSLPSFMFSKEEFPTMEEIFFLVYAKAFPEHVN